MSESKQEVIWVSPYEILRKWGTSDAYTGKYDGLRAVLKQKRQGYSYRHALLFLKSDGFLCPLAFITMGGRRIQHEGHHRLAAAIDLGYKKIPYVEVRDWDESLEKTTPQKYLGKERYEKVRNTTNPDFIHPKNPLPSKYSQQLAQV